MSPDQRERFVRRRQATRERGAVAPSPIAKLGHGAAGVARAVTGTGGAASDLIERRTAICAACNFGVTIGGVLRQCSLCKCSTWAKVRNAAEKCPDGKW